MLICLGENVKLLSGECYQVLLGLINTKKMRRQAQVAIMGQTVNAFKTLVEKNTRNKKGIHVKPNNESRWPNIAAVESSKY
jgi:hypothetical protein